MKRLVQICLLSGMIATVVGSASIAVAAPVRRATKAGLPSGCVALIAEYEDASKGLAALKADGLTDTSAVRATMRETQASNILAQARITMDLLTSKKCGTPSAAPSASLYLAAALDCSLARATKTSDAAWARVRGETASSGAPLPECDRSTWVAK